MPSGELIIEVRKNLLAAASDACSSCDKCNLCDNRYGESVFADGSIHAKVMAIGEGPGQYEQRTLIPFCHKDEYINSRCFMYCANHENCFPPSYVTRGTPLPSVGCSFLKMPDSVTRKRLEDKAPTPNSTAGILNAALDGIFPRESSSNRLTFYGEPASYSGLYITNIVKCRPTDNNGKDRPPTTEEQRACGRWLNIQMRLIQPKVIVLVGRVAAQRFLGSKFSVTASSGMFAPRKDLEIVGVPPSVEYVGVIMHPAGVARRGDVATQEVEIEKMRKVFEKARGVIE